jgi:glycosyltransferase involved in cell wall biosynthesis
MLGWELPPFNSGGLGEACLGLAHSLAEKGVGITFVLPRKMPLKFDFMNVVFADIDENDLLLNPYTSSSELPPDFIRGAMKFAEKIEKIALKHQFDVIHSHDWMTYPAGIMAGKATKKPLVAHVHSTEIDRTGGHFPNVNVYRIEKQGFEEADKIISVSDYTKGILAKGYGIKADKIDVVHNGIDNFSAKKLEPALTSLKKLGYKVVLFLGRITLQKGPEYFVREAKRVNNFRPKTIFVVVGAGEMLPSMISEAARSGILDKFIFTGFLRGEERDRIYQTADIYVMPSVSEPFGITPLEAIANGTPTLVSKQSGVAEVIKHALKLIFGT